MMCHCWRKSTILIPVSCGNTFLSPLVGHNTLGPARTRPRCFASCFDLEKPNPKTTKETKGFCLIQRKKMQTGSWSVLVVLLFFFCFPSFFSFFFGLQMLVSSYTKENWYKSQKLTMHWPECHVSRLITMYVSLSKNYSTRSSSWDELISFSRVSWPKIRQQVNSLIQLTSQKN